MRGQLPWRMTGLYIVTQVVGGMVGVWAYCSNSRSGNCRPQFATFGLGLTIFGTTAHAPSATSYAVKLYITSAYWFTASTSFANPAGSRNDDCIAFATMVDLPTMFKNGNDDRSRNNDRSQNTSALQGEAGVMALRHISILLYVLRHARWGRRETMRNTTALQGEHDGDTTAHIHFALCASGLEARCYREAR